MTSPLPGPVFPGVAKLLELIRSLYRRPGSRERTENSAFSGDQPLPLVLLVRGTEPTGFLAALASRLRQSPPPRVPHALVDAVEAEERTRRRWNLVDGDETGVRPTRQSPILPLLDELVDRLARETFAGSRLSRFDRYRLVDWLTGQWLEPAYGRDDRANIVQVLRTWVGGGQPGTGGHAVSTMDVAPDIWARMVVWAISALSRIVDSRWLRERVPRLGGERRWLMRQPYMVPRHSVDFLGFAERLTVGYRGAENPEQLKKLLVHAFLEDLRVGYRRFRWRIVPRPAGWRRTAYVVALLENVADANGGRELLQLINEVRNETGQLDPLLVIAETGDGPPTETGRVTQPVTPGEVDSAVKAWRNRLPARRQKLEGDARYLYIRLPDRTESGALSASDRDAWDIYVSFRPPRSPRLAQRRVPAFLVVLTLVAAGWLPAVESWEHVRADCAVRGVPADWWPGVIAVEPRSLQCVGYSDTGRFVFGNDPRLSETQRLVFAQNDEAKRLHGQDRDRALLTLIYFSALTHKDSDPKKDHAVAEELEGLLLRQRQKNNVDSKGEPLLRVIVANGGREMNHARWVAGRFLLPLIAGDPTIVGVVGMDRTVAETEAAISDFGLRAGVPVVGTTLTGTGLTDKSPLFFQMVAGNQRQAELIKAYAAHIKKSQVVIYHGAGSDSYVETLVKAFTENGTGDLGGHGVGSVKADEREWSRSPNDLKIACEADGIAFYAGREDNFKTFLTALYNRCQPGSRPQVVANDAVSRLIATRRPGQLSEVAGISVRYVSLGSKVVLAGSDCVAGGTGNGWDNQLAGFCQGYSGLRRELAERLAEKDRSQSNWPGERVGVAYDAAQLFIHATLQLQQDGTVEPGVTPHRAALAQTFGEMDFTGATGPINFRDHRDGTGRTLALLEIADISKVERAPSCEFILKPAYTGVCQGQQ